MNKTLKWITTLGLLCTPAFAQSWTGISTVIDGDTLEIRGVRFRASGVDAMESSQFCVAKNGSSYRCGQQAALKLADKVRGKNVTCVQKDKDRYGRVVAVCTVVGEKMSLNEWLVRNGLAVAYTQYSKDYVQAEAYARTNKLGIWAGTFQMPWDYRKNKNNPPTAGTAVKPTGEVYYKNCTEARKARVSPILRGQPGYRAALDADGNGVACQ